ncbi:ketopantoate reductase family protein [Thiosocius teredinicola]|uniref:ketopantoate reductase family protein n=1 Tax=Thiosocius teredinicola TaxID=1973002 RepID=UPI002FE4AF3C
MTDSMRFLVIGAGGIGAYYGARLMRAGCDVTFVARGRHLEVMQTNGLQIDHPDFTFKGAVNAVSTAALTSSHNPGEYDLVILTTKAGSTQSLLDELQAWLTNADTLPVLSLQNGVDNERQIAAALGSQRTIGGLAVRIGGHVICPGLIEATGPAQVVLGAWPNAQQNAALQCNLGRIVDTFDAAGIPTTLSDDIQLELWKKLLINNGVNPLSALTGLDTRTLSNHPALSSSVYRLMEEAATAALSDGITIGKPDIDAMFELISTFDAIKTSMLVDIEKGRPLELDEIAGAVAERCRQLGEPAVLTEMVHGLVSLKLAQQARG